jgi:DNA polymerase-3 subunit epsilon
MKMIQKITALDFETANYFRGSICAAGVAVIEDGCITGTKRWLIKPHNKCGVFIPEFIKIHSITPDMVKDAPSFVEIFPELRIYLEGAVVIAHNSSFDMTALRDVLTLYSMEFPEFEYGCTMELSKKVWKKISGYSLDKVCSALNHSFNHHDALEDAVACAHILLGAAKELGDVRKVMDIMDRGKIFPGQPHLMSRIYAANNFGEQVDIKTIKPGVEKFDETNPLFEKKVVFTGTISMPRQEAMQAAVDLGARLGNSVTLDTDFLVTGERDSKFLVKGKIESSKTKKAVEYAARGSAIKVINESQFMALIGR